MLGWPERDEADIALLSQALHIQNRVQAHHLVSRYFPSALQQAFYRLLATLDRLFSQ